MSQQESEIEQLKERVYHLERMQNEKLDRIERLLAGDKYDSRGLVERVKDNEHKLQEYHRMKAKAGGVITVLTFVASSVTTFLIYLLNKYL